MRDGNAWARKPSLLSMGVSLGRNRLIARFTMATSRSKEEFAVTQSISSSCPRPQARRRVSVFKTGQNFGWQAPTLLRCGIILTLMLGFFALYPAPADANVQNVVTNCGAVGDGSHDDTSAIQTCIGNLHPGDTLLFPCTTNSTYKISSQLTILQNSNQVFLTDITVDGSSCAIIKDTYSNPGTPAGRIMVIGGNGTSLYATYGSSVALSGAAHLRSRWLSRGGPESCICFWKHGHRHDGSA